MAGKRLGKLISKGGASAPSADSKPTRQLGSIKPEARGINHGSGVRSCRINCAGFYKDGMWHHDLDCPDAAMTWRAAGHTRETWACPFKCEPHELPSGWTHHWSCEFWNGTDRTPFD